MHKTGAAPLSAVSSSRIRSGKRSGDFPPGYFNCLGVRSPCHAMPWRRQDTVCGDGRIDQHVVALESWPPRKRPRRDICPFLDAISYGGGASLLHMRDCRHQKERSNAHSYK
jgi:hypothetical protein